MGEAVEAAVISLTMSGAEAVSRQADKVTVDLSSAKRSGENAEKASRAAETAAHDAESAAAGLQQEATRAVGLLAKASKLGGGIFGSSGLSALGGELGFGLKTFGRAGGLLEALIGGIPGGGLAIAGLSAAAGIYGAFQREEKDESKEEKQAERIAKHLNKIGDDDLQSQMLAQVGLSRVDRAIGGGSR